MPRAPQLKKVVVQHTQFADELWNSSELTEEEVVVEDEQLVDVWTRID
jgi:hypothetical protein